MFNTVVTHAQLVGIGFSFGIVGPCLLVCTPILITYIAGMRKRWRESLPDILIFLSGRIAAYLVLGCIAGLSGSLLRKFASPGLSAYLRPIAGILSMIFAVIVLTYKGPPSRDCKAVRTNVYNFGSLFALGFVLGVSPCAPLIALLLDIALMSKNALDGMTYTLSFGIGTFISGLIVAGALSGIFTSIPAKFLKSRQADFVFRIMCALLLVGLGLSLFI